MKTLQEKTKTVKSDFPDISNKELLRILIYDVIEELKHHKRRDALNMMREWAYSGRSLALMIATIRLRRKL